MFITDILISLSHTFMGIHVNINVTLFLFLFHFYNTIKMISGKVLFKSQQDVAFAIVFARSIITF